MPRLNGQAVTPGADERRDQGNCVAIDITLVVVYAALLVWFSFFTPIRSLDHFLWNTGAYRSSPYEFLVGVLFFPLIVMCLTGWLRMILIWGAIRSRLASGNSIYSDHRKCSHKDNCTKVCESKQKLITIVVYLFHLI
jgi:hypothetical protein